VVRKAKIKLLARITLYIEKEIRKKVTINLMNNTDYGEKT
jgi:hypothetical protein